MGKKIIAFAGRKQSGKSTAANILMDNGYVDIKFAGPLKSMLRAMYKECGVGDLIIDAKLEGNLKEVACPYLCGQTPRYAMQTLGTEWRDLIDTQLWSNMFSNRVKSSVIDTIVCSDFRFPHEAVTLKDLGAEMYLIKRSGQESVDTHPSELFYDELPVDGVIYNDGTKEEFETKIRDMFPRSTSLGVGFDYEGETGLEYFSR